MVNPEYLDRSRLPSVLKTWDLLVAPEPVPIENDPCRSSAAGLD